MATKQLATEAPHCSPSGVRRWKAAAWLKVSFRDLSSPSLLLNRTQPGEWIFPTGDLFPGESKAEILLRTRVKLRFPDPNNSSISGSKADTLSVEDRRSLFRTIWQKKETATRRLLTMKSTVNKPRPWAQSFWSAAQCSSLKSEQSGRDHQLPEKIRGGINLA